MNINSSPQIALKSKFVYRSSRSGSPSDEGVSTTSPQGMGLAEDSPAKDLFTPTQEKLRRLISQDFGAHGDGSWANVDRQDGCSDVPDEKPEDPVSCDGFYLAPENQVRLMTKAQEGMNAIREAEAKASAQYSETFGHISGIWERNRNDLGSLREANRNQLERSQGQHLNAFMAFLRE